MVLVLVVGLVLPLVELVLLHAPLEFTHAGMWCVTCVPCARYSEFHVAWRRLGAVAIFF